MAFPPRHDPVSHLIENVRSVLGNDPIEALNNFRETDSGENIFEDVIATAYGRSGNRNQWRRPDPIQDDFSIDYSRDRNNQNRYDQYDRYESNPNLDIHRSPSELMNTLGRHANGITQGRNNDCITRNQLENYLARKGESLTSQDLVDLMMIKRDFGKIARADREWGISYSDMARFSSRGRGRNEDQEDSMNRRLLEENARLRSELDRLGRGNEREDDYSYTPRMQDGENIITERTGPNGHLYAAGADLPLSQEEFKRHYNIPENIDLTKFMRGKQNDGSVPNFWTSDVAAGLGGRDDNNNLRWDNAGHHEPALDFQRNFAQLAEIFKALPIDEQITFTLNFARTQGDVLRSHGITLLAADNEKIQIHENGVTKYIDLVQDVESDRKLLQWG